MIEDVEHPLVGERFSNRSFPDVRVFGDESGATGSNLVDVQDRVFALGTVRRTDGEAREVVERLRSTCRIQAGELKFRQFSQENRIDCLVSYLERELEENRLFAVAVDKHYMAMAKIVDFLLEEFWFRKGANLYEGGLAQQYARTLFVEGRAQLSSFTYDALLESFVACCGQLPSAADVQVLFRLLRRALLEAKSDNLTSVLSAILESRSSAEEIFVELAQPGVPTLDPLTPCVAQAARSWSERVSGRSIAMVLDENPLLTPEWLRIVNGQLANPVDMVVYHLPPVAVRLETGSSWNHAGIQLADLVAGASRVAADVAIRPEIYPAESGGRRLFGLLAPHLCGGLVPSLW